MNPRGVWRSRNPWPLNEPRRSQGTLVGPTEAASGVASQAGKGQTQLGCARFPATDHLARQPQTTFYIFDGNLRPKVDIARLGSPSLTRVPTSQALRSVPSLCIYKLQRRSRDAPPNPAIRAARRVPTEVMNCSRALDYTVTRASSSRSRRHARRAWTSNVAFAKSRSASEASSRPR